MNQLSNLSLLKLNLAAVEERIAAACRRAGRDRGEITLVAVTKSVDAEVAHALTQAGVLDLGENRPQELWRKAALIPGVRWHMIGHFQRNKIERTLPLATLIHSVDSIRLLEALNEEAARSQATARVLLEVNVGGEQSKQGFHPEALEPLVPTLASLRHVEVCGLMTMAPLQDAELCRPLFARLRGLRDRWRAALPTMEHLSMGMSNDFEVAIEEGATYLRLGSVLFEGLPR